MRHAQAQIKAPHASRQHGFTLIEALIAMLVLSVGLLGVAALQVKSMQYSHASLQRSVAVVHANDLVERLWAGVCALPDARSNIENEWRTAHENTLPNWDGTVVANLGGDLPVYVITVSWDDERASDGVRQEFVYDAIVPNLVCE